MKRAFTLVEMIVVVAVIAILMASIGASVYKAQLRSRIARAEAESNEITNAIRAYENFVDTGIPERNNVDADESSLGFILGDGTDRAGNKVPVLYNASVVAGKIRDPWGTPYKVRVNSAGAEDANDQVARGMETGVFLPNRYNKMAGGAR
jgi:prepilin-type N-terminal cleavage/methylation domain-containing protein